MASSSRTLRIVTDPAHGGRWTSLRAEGGREGGREWLWRRADPAREGVVPGDAFVDVGGVEECVPTVRGVPDHGDAWGRVWSRDGDTESVRCEGFSLTRTVRDGRGEVEVDYVLAADPGFRFVWAAHALLDLSPRATLHMPEGARTRLYPSADGPWVEGSWPAPRGVALDRLGPDDGTAVGAVVEADSCCVHDDEDRLTLSVRAADGQPVSVALWRNLGGFPAERPYRSTGVEPMVGRVFDLAEAGPGDAGRVPTSGEARWRLTLSAGCGCA
ncbi:hypothetical protein [Streptomyces pseudovenezuelae]|uniref:hypothetical protein n=1 Tax=Streptomyces pseudovenezuelae TaxID=67350 RepID=UPI003D78BE00